MNDMTNGIPYPNYTQAPNVLFDVYMPLMSDAEFKVTCAIVRKIIGYHKQGPEPISYSQLERLTGLSRDSVAKGVRAAIERGVVEVAGKGKRGVNLFTLRFKEEIADKSDQSEKLTSQENGPELVRKTDSQKKVPKESLIVLTDDSEGVGEGEKNAAPPPAVGEETGAPSASSTPEPKPKPKPNAKEPKCPGPYQANLSAVSQIYAGTEDGFSTRWSTIASWLSGGEHEVKGMTLPGLEPFARPEEVLEFREWYEDTHDEIAIPRDVDKFAEYFQEYRADARWRRRKQRRLQRGSSKPAETSPALAAFKSLVGGAS